MLELTVLQRYNKGGKRFCDVLGILQIDFETRRIICDESTVIFNKKYAYQKSVICNIFTSKKSLKQACREIGESGMKVAETKFSEDDTDIKMVILIED